VYFNVFQNNRFRRALIKFRNKA